MESSVNDANPEKDNEIYARLLRQKKRGYALYIPEPNQRLPIAYQRIGVSVGDVGIITADGGFSFLFNICAPHNDPINPRVLPEDFSPLYPPLTEMDITKFPRFKSGSYMASSSMVKKDSSESDTRGLHFETSASEGAVLTMPEGATSLNLENDIAFSNYLAANLEKWYEFVYRVRGKSIGNGELRLVTGCDKTSAWGIATVSGMSQHSLKFKALDTADTANSSTTVYTWECSGMVEVRVGPDNSDIEALRRDGTDDHPLDMTTLCNQCLFVRTMNPKLEEEDWEKLMQNLGRSTVNDPNTPAGMNLYPLLRSRPSGSSAESSSQPGSHQGTTGTQGYAMGKQSGITISTMPKSFVPYHPSNDLNRQLLLKFPGCRMVITKDQDWLSALREDEEMISDPKELLERVLASHNVRIENGVLLLDRKKQEMPEMRRPISSEFISRLVEQMRTEDKARTLVHHQQYYISGGDLFIIVEQTLFRVHSQLFRDSDWFSNKLSASPGGRPQGFDDSTAIILDGLSPGDFAKFLGFFYTPSSVSEIPDKDQKVILALLDRWSFPKVKDSEIKQLEDKAPPPRKGVKRDYGAKSYPNALSGLSLTGIAGTGKSTYHRDFEGSSDQHRKPQP
ncbi:hypothetical protein M413DRAFT_263918 [Hebeloma cylindrosporum]|uniref:BTB domain-containing protein n=1 Tax=Hebeloma cylindrosporum TaxID=76867 RepID=A0A0C3CDH7_HEBCY|nr:hypothetical protein M413DRAFT_263918 [Hebeloma cylindrosporum h7]